MSNQEIKFKSIAEGLNELTGGVCGANPALDSMIEQTYFSGANHVLGQVLMINKGTLNKTISSEEANEAMNKLVREVNTFFKEMLAQEGEQAATPAPAEAPRILLVN